jgi:hypothetical protein
MKSRVAVLGTLGERHLEPIGYDLDALERVVREIEPDLLCAEIHPNDWAAHDVDGMSPEYRDALVPLAKRTDVVIVPVAGSRNRGLVTPKGGRLLALRTFLVGLLNAHLRWMQRGNRGLGALNSGAWGAVCDGLCSLTARLCGRDVLREWDAANRALFENVLAAVRRDPGGRVLVTVDCRRRHRLEHELRGASEVELVHYETL